MSEKANKIKPEDILVLETVVSVLEKIQVGTFQNQNDIGTYIQTTLTNKKLGNPNLNISNLKERVLEELTSRLSKNQKKTEVNNPEDVALKDVEVVVANKVLTDLSRDYRSGKYGNNDLKRIFTDISSNLDFELSKAGIQVSDQKRILLMMYVIFGWGEQNKDRYLGDKRQIEHHRGTRIEGNQSVTTDEFHKAINELKDEIGKDKEKKRAFFDRLFGFDVKINVGVNVDSSGFGNAFFEFLKRLIFGS